MTSADAVIKTGNDWQWPYNTKNKKKIQDHKRRKSSKFELISSRSRNLVIGKWLKYSAKGSELRSFDQ